MIFKKIEAFTHKHSKTVEGINAVLVIFVVGILTLDLTLYISNIIMSLPITHLPPVE